MGRTSQEVTNGHAVTHIFQFFLIHILFSYRAMTSFFFNRFRLKRSVSAEATILDSAIDTLKTNNDKRCFGPSPGRHLPELKSG